MAFAAKYKGDSPLFIDLIKWLEKKNVRRLRAFFPLRRYSTWVQVRDGNGKTFFWADDLDKHREGIRADLVDPLFVRQGLNVRFESGCRRHRTNNAYCCVEFYRKRLQKIPADALKKTLRDFQSDFRNAAPGVQFPFTWILEGRDPIAKELAKINDQLEKINDRLAQFEEDERTIDFIQKTKEETEAFIEEEKITGAEEQITRAEQKDLLWASELARALDERKRRYVLDRCAQLLATMKWAQGKPGRHPKEFNVLVYHIIKRCTRWKIDWKRRASGLDPYKRRKDGQHRLETDWKLVVFLLLDLHVHQHKLPEVARFISSHKKEPANVALRKMQAWLLNIRKNFPPMHGLTMNTEGVPRPETGYRKVIVGDDGRLRIVQL